MANKFKEGDKIVLKLGITPNSTNGSSFYLSEAISKFLHKDKTMEVFIVDGEAIKIVGTDYWYHEDWFDLVETVDLLEKYTIHAMFCKLTQHSVCATHLKKGINNIIKAIEKNNDIIYYYQALRDYIKINCAAHNSLYITHSTERRYATSILSVMFIKRFGKELDYEADNLIGQLPDYVHTDYIQHVHPYHLYNTIKTELKITNSVTEKQTATQPSIVELINPQESDQIMPTVDNKVAIQQVTFIYGNDAANVTDDNVFEMIRTLEAKIESSDKIKNKPKKLKTQIEKYKAEIDELVKFVDGR